MIVIQWNTNSIEEARNVANLLVKERIVACANIIPAIESIYIWKDKVEHENEIKVIFKTVEAKFNEVKAIIKQHTSYDVPEIIKLEVAGGDEDYLQWVQTTIKE
jgi:periplasmic divalent cation tolerance protein